MANASGTNVRVGFIEETVPGTTPAGALTLIRDVEFRPGGEYETIQSAERTSARNIADLIRTNARGGFSFTFEESYANLDKQLESLYGAAWATDVLKVGTTMKAHTTELQFTDIAQFAQYRYSVYNDLTLSVAKGAIIGGSMGAVSMFPTWTTTTVGNPASPTAAPTNSVMDPVGNVQLIQEGGSGSVLGPREFTMHLSNGIITYDQLASLDPMGFDYGQFKAEGTLAAYFADETYITKWTGWTDTSLKVTLGGASAKKYEFLFSRVKIGNVRLTGLSVNNGVVATMEWQALDHTSDTTSKITRTTGA